MAVMVVRHLDASLRFYTEVLGLEIADRTPTAVLLASADGGRLILRAMGEQAHRAPGSAGVEYVLWVASGEDDLRRIERVLKSRSAYIETRSGEGYTVVEGRDPDGGAVMVAYPGPDEAGLRVLPTRIYAW